MDPVVGVTWWPKWWHVFLVRIFNVLSRSPALVAVYSLRRWSLVISAPALARLALARLAGPLALARLAGPFGPGPFGRPIWPWPVWPAHLALARLAVARLAGPFGPGPFGRPGPFGPGLFGRPNFVATSSEHQPRTTNS